jgi:hypothetical protein
VLQNPGTVKKKKKYWDNPIAPVRVWHQEIDVTSLATSLPSDFLINNDHFCEIQLKRKMYKIRKEHQKGNTKMANNYFRQGRTVVRVG